MIHPERVTEMIKAGIPDAQVQTVSPDGEHFEVTVVSAVFAGKRLVQQHQLVYGSLKDAMASEAIHALALKTYTPELWAVENPVANSSLIKGFGDRDFTANSSI